MSRAPIILVILVVILLAGLVWLSRSPASIAPHRIEKSVTIDGAAGGATDGAAH